MRKAITMLVAIMIMFSVLSPHQAHAATGIRVYIDGMLLSTDQDPIIVNGRTLVPLRSIFEALNARVNWDQKTQTVTAIKRETKIVLKIGDRNATINDRTTSLDTPAQVINGRTLVPVRFVSEALGEEVTWDSKTQIVSITTSKEEVEAVSKISVMLENQYSDGRDVSIHFTPPADQSDVREYRIFIVKADNANSFDLTKARNVKASNYTAVSVNNAHRITTLSAHAKDSDGTLLRTNQSYRVFVLTVGNESYALSNSSAPFVITGSLAAEPVTNVTMTDVGDYGDGRDLLVSFTRPSDESNISGYRVMIVKTKDASKFNLTAANAVTSDYYTAVSKSSSGNTLNAILHSASRDTSGELITNGVAYTAFVLSLSNNAVASLNRLSTGSQSVTLASSVSTPVIFSVADVGNNGDGRDLSISFIKAPDESRISSYRIFVVRAADADSFTLSDAAKVSSGRYYDIAKTGRDIVSTTLPSNMKDVKGSAVKNGVAYRLFVMGVSNNSIYSNALSLPSSTITLSSENTISAVSQLSVDDAGDSNSGQDLRVSFRKPSNESNINHYRIFVVRDANASSFQLATAAAITDPSLYTVVNKTGSDQSVELPSNARDVNGALIQNGVKYRVFVMSVGDGAYWGINALSSASPVITLTNQTTIAAVKNVEAAVRGTNGDASDIEVSFSMSETESAVKEYRVIVVPARIANTFALADANRAVTNGNYMVIQKLGRDISQRLSASLKDSEGNALRSGERYRVFVLATNGGTANALSGPSDEITIPSRVVPAPEVQNVTAQQGSGTMNLIVSFTNANEAGIAHYAVLLVRETDGNLTENKANSYYLSGNYTKVGRTERSAVLTGASIDVNGAPMAYNTPYKAYVLSIADGSEATANKLSASVGSVILKEN